MEDGKEVDPNTSVGEPDPISKSKSKSKSRKSKSKSSKSRNKKSKKKDTVETEEEKKEEEWHTDGEDDAPTESSKSRKEKSKKKERSKSKSRSKSKLAEEEQEEAENQKNGIEEILSSKMEQADEQEELPFEFYSPVNFEDIWPYLESSDYAGLGEWVHTLKESIGDQKLPEKYAKELYTIIRRHQSPEMRRDAIEMIMANGISFPVVDFTHLWCAILNNDNEGVFRWARELPLEETSNNGYGVMENTPDSLLPPHFMMVLTAICAKAPPPLNEVILDACACAGIITPLDLPASPKSTRLMKLALRLAKNGILFRPRPKSLRKSPDVNPSANFLESAYAEITPFRKMSIFHEFFLDYLQQRRLKDVVQTYLNWYDLAIVWKERQKIRKQMMLDGDGVCAGMDGYDANGPGDDADKAMGLAADALSAANLEDTLKQLGLPMNENMVMALKGPVEPQAPPYMITHNVLACRNVNSKDSPEDGSMHGMFTDMKGNFLINQDGLFSMGEDELDFDVGTYLKNSRLASMYEAYINDLVAREEAGLNERKFGLTDAERMQLEEDSQANCMFWLTNFQAMRAYHVSRPFTMERCKFVADICAFATGMAFANFQPGQYRGVLTLPKDETPDKDAFTEFPPDEIGFLCLNYLDMIDRCKNSHMLPGGCAGRYLKHSLYALHLAMYLDTAEILFRYLPKADWADDKQHAQYIRWSVDKCYHAGVNRRERRKREKGDFEQLRWLFNSLSQCFGYAEEGDKGVVLRLMTTFVLLYDEPWPQDLVRWWVEYQGTMASGGAEFCRFFVHCGDLIGLSHADMVFRLFEWNKYGFFYVSEQGISESPDVAVLEHLGVLFGSRLGVLLAPSQLSKDPADGETDAVSMPVLLDKTTEALFNLSFPNHSPSTLEPRFANTKGSETVGTYMLQIAKRNRDYLLPVLAFSFAGLRSRRTSIRRTQEAPLELKPSRRTEAFLDWLRMMYAAEILPENDWSNEVKNKSKEDPAPNKEHDLVKAMLDSSKTNFASLEQVFLIFCSAGRFRELELAFQIFFPENVLLIVLDFLRAWTQRRYLEAQEKFKKYLVTIDNTPFDPASTSYIPLKSKKTDPVTWTGNMAWQMLQAGLPAGVRKRKKLGPGVGDAGGEEEWQSWDDRITSEHGESVGSGRDMRLWQNLFHSDQHPPAWLHLNLTAYDRNFLVTLFDETKFVHAEKVLSGIRPTMNSSLYNPVLFGGPITTLSSTIRPTVEPEPPLTFALCQQRYRTKLAELDALMEMENMLASKLTAERLAFINDVSTLNVYRGFRAALFYQAHVKYTVNNRVRGEKDYKEELIPLYLSVDIWSECMEDPKQRAREVALYKAVITRLAGRIYFLLVLLDKPKVIITVPVREEDLGSTQAKGATIFTEDVDLRLVEWRHEHTGLGTDLMTTGLEKLPILHPGKQQYLPFISADGQVDPVDMWDFDLVDDVIDTLIRTVRFKDVCTIVNHVIEHLRVRSHSYPNVDHAKLWGKMKATVGILNMTRLLMWLANPNLESFKASMVHGEAEDEGSEEGEEPDVDSPQQLFDDQLSQLVDVPWVHGEYMDLSPPSIYDEDAMWKRRVAWGARLSNDPITLLLNRLFSFPVYRHLLCDLFLSQDVKDQAVANNEAIDEDTGLPFPKFDVDYKELVNRFLALNDSQRVTLLHDIMSTACNPRYHNIQHDISVPSEAELASRRPLSNSVVLVASLCRFLALALTFTGKRVSERIAEGDAEMERVRSTTLMKIIATFAQRTRAVPTYANPGMNPSVEKVTLPFVLQLAQQMEYTGVGITLLLDMPPADFLALVLSYLGIKQTNDGVKISVDMQVVDGLISSGQLSFLPRPMEPLGGKELAVIMVEAYAKSRLQSDYKWSREMLTDFCLAFKDQHKSVTGVSALRTLGLAFEARARKQTLPELRANGISSAYEASGLAIPFIPISRVDFDVLHAAFIANICDSRFSDRISIVLEALNLGLCQLGCRGASIALAEETETKEDENELVLFEEMLIRTLLITNLSRPFAPAQQIAGLLNGTHGYAKQPREVDLLRQKHDQTVYLFHCIRSYSGWELLKKLERLSYQFTKLSRAFKAGMPAEGVYSIDYKAHGAQCEHAAAIIQMELELIPGRLIHDGFRWESKPDVATFQYKGPWPSEDEFAPLWVKYSGPDDLNVSEDRWMTKSSFRRFLSDSFLSRVSSELLHTLYENASAEEKRQYTVFKAIEELREMHINAYEQQLDQLPDDVKLREEDLSALLEEEFYGGEPTDMKKIDWHGKLEPKDVPRTVLFFAPDVYGLWNLTVTAADQKKSARALRKLKPVHQKIFKQAYDATSERPTVVIHER